MLCQKIIKILLYIRNPDFIGIFLCSKISLEERGKKQEERCCVLRKENRGKKQEARRKMLCFENRKQRQEARFSGIF